MKNVNYEMNLIVLFTALESFGRKNQQNNIVKNVANYVVLSRFHRGLA